jgi:signal transduction histidine kinase
MPLRRGHGLRTVVVSTFVLAVTITTVAVSLIGYAVVRADDRAFQRTSEVGNYQHVVDLAQINAQVKGPIARWAGEHPDAATAGGLTEYVQQTLGLRFASVVDPSHPQHGCSYHPCWDEFPADIQAAARDRRTFLGGARPPEARSRYWLAITPLQVDPGDGQLVLASSTLRLGSETSHRVLWYGTAIVIGAGLVLSVLMGLTVSASIRRPLNRVTAAARRFGQGDVTARAPAGGSDELRQLGATFNAMADELRTTLDRLHVSQDLQRRFVADVSHELRTPLSAMLATLEGLDSPSPASRQRSAVLLAEQTRRLATLTEDLLEISRFDAGQADLRSEPVDLAVLVQDAARSVSTELEVPIAVIGSAVRLVDPRRMHTVARNLLSNAVRHGVAPIRVLLADGTDGTFSLTVEDQGPGIPPQQQALVFDRFAQGTPARRGGTGLGLAIVQENVRLHGGALHVSDAAPTRFTVVLPAATAVREE